MFWFYMSRVTVSKVNSCFTCTWVVKYYILHNLYNKLNAIVKWNGSYSKSFCVTRGIRQGSVPSPYLFNNFINQLLLDLNNSDAGVRIGDTLYNYMAYAEDITLFSTNVQDLQNLIDVCVKGGNSNLGLKNLNAWLLESVRYTKTQSGSLVKMSI